MFSRISKSVSWAIALAFVAFLPLALSAQDSAKPSTTAGGDPTISKWDVFAGYSYLAPHGTASNGTTAESIDYGAIFSVARYFNKYVGVQIEGDEHILNEAPSNRSCPSCGSTWANNDFSGGSAGLIFRFPSPDLTPFVHGLVGGEFVGMEPFVTSGPRSGVAHTTWKRRTVVPGDVVILETAACYNRYHAALYRTIFVGDVPALAEDMYKVCDEALSAAIEVLRPGNTCADVHAAAQAVIDRHGYTDGFRKRSGYSMGISFAPDWGEGNILSLYRGIDVPLQPGMVFHVPITLRDYAKFTVAVSDTIIVTEGAARPLSKLERVALRV